MNYRTATDQRSNADGSWDALPRALNHHTITTGHSRLSERSEVGEDLGLETHVEEMLSGAAPIPNFQGMFARASENNGTLLVDVLERKQVLVRFMVAPRNDAASKTAFDHLLQNDIHRKGRREPGAPYCSAAITFAGLLQPQELLWIADYERCVAWTWLAMKTTC